MEAKGFANLSRPIALVVDDEPLILMDTSDILSDEGFSIIEAQTADQALEFLDRHSSLQLVFTDIQMPGDLNGIDLARTIGQRWPNIKVIIASGAITPQPGDLPVNATFLSKPISAELVHRVLKDSFSSPSAL